MKSFIEKSKEPEYSYPKLKEGLHGIVWLFTSETTGFMVYVPPGSKSKLGNTKQGGGCSKYKDFKGKVILQND